MNQGSYNQGPYNHGPDNQGPYNQNPYNQGSYNQNPYNQGPYHQRPDGNRPNQPNDGWSIASMVLGILSILVNCWSGYGFVAAIVMGILAFIFGMMSKRLDGRKSGMAIAGIVTGCIGFAIGIILVGIMILAGGLAYYMIRDYYYDYHYYNYENIMTVLFTLL